MDRQPTQTVFRLADLPDLALAQVMAGFCGHCSPHPTCRDSVCESRHSVGECRASCNYQRCHQMSTLENQNTRTLAALALTCRDLNWLATPYLYHRPYLADNYLFLRTISSPPRGAQLARHVKAIHQMPQQFPSPHSEDTQLEIFKTFFINNPGAFSCGTGLQGLMAVSTGIDSWQIPFSVLLSLCNNITELLVELNHWDTAPLFADFQPDAFPKLKRLIVVASTAIFHVACIQLVKPLLTAAPNLSRVEGVLSPHGYICTHDRRTRIDTSTFLAHNSIRHVRITRGWLSNDEIRGLVEGVPALEVLEYETAGVQRDFHAVWFYQILCGASCASTLRKLSLKITGDLVPSDDYCQPSISLDGLTSLKGFTKLEELKMDPSSIFWWRDDDDDDDDVRCLVDFLPDGLVTFMCVEDGQTCSYRGAKWAYDRADVFVGCLSSWRLL